MNAVMNIRAPKNAGIFLLAEDLLASQEGLYLMELLVICFPREVSRCAVGKETVGRCVYTSVFFFSKSCVLPKTNITGTLGTSNLTLPPLCIGNWPSGGVLAKRGSSSIRPHASRPPCC